jgi:hypothetical protein
MCQTWQQVFCPAPLTRVLHLAALPLRCVHRSSSSLPLPRPPHPLSLSTLIDCYCFTIPCDGRGGDAPCNVFSVALAMVLQVLYSAPHYLFPPSSCQTLLPNLYSSLSVDCYFLVCSAALLSPPLHCLCPLFTVPHLSCNTHHPFPSQLMLIVGSPPTPKYATSIMQRYSNSDEDATSHTQNRCYFFTLAPLSPPHHCPLWLDKIPLPLHLLTPMMHVGPRFQT